MPHTHPTATGRVIAFLDLGTNAARLLLVRINPNQSYTVLSLQKETVRLGEGEFAHHEHLQQAAMDRAVHVCRHLVEMARSQGAAEVIAVATAATREAVNQAEFLRLFHEETGIDLRVISGREEARLVYLGISSGIHLEDRTAIFIDIGGGSTELAVGNQHEHFFLESLKLGAIRLTNLFLPDPSGPVDEARYAAMQQHVRNTMVRAKQRIATLPFTQAFGSSGTVENLAAVAGRTLRKRVASRPEYLALPELQQIARTLCSMPIEERRKVPGLNPERADIIIAGAAVLQTLMEELDIAEIVPSERGLRDGLLVDYLTRTAYGPGYADLSVRARSVQQLGRICHFDEAHAAHTARLAQSLFDSARALGLHSLDDQARELLGWAAQLHDIGAFLAYHNHHQHGYYFIRNAELLGFDQHEVDIIAATVFYHRKALPRKSDPEFAILDADGQATVRVLCVLLRLAESLDRSHTSQVAQAAFSIPDKRRLVLEITAPHPAPLELWSARTHAPAVKKIFRRELVVEMAE